MKHKLLSVITGTLLALGSTGCLVDDHASIHIRNVIGGQPKSDCVISVDESLQKGRGSIDLGYTRGYLAAVLVENTLSATAIQQQGQTVSPAERNDFHIERIALRYETNPNVPGLTERTIASSGTVEAGGKLAMGVDLLTFDNAEILAAQPLPPGGIELKVFMRLGGRFTNGSEHETPEFMFPLTVYSTTPPTCGPDEVLAEPEGQDAPCGNIGQDGTGLICVPQGA